MVMKKIEGNTQIVFQTVLSGPTFGEIRVQVPNDTEVAYLDHQFLGGEVGREPLEIGTSNSHGLVRYVTINLEKFRTQTTIQIITMRKKIDLHEEVAKAILGQYQKPMWVINEALEFIRGIRPDVMRYGWTVELGGGVLQNGHSNSDLDLVFVSRSDVEPWPVHTILEKFFSDWTFTQNQSRVSAKIVLNIHKVARNNKSIDLIFVEGVSSHQAENDRSKT